jgi:hypothetical protein
MTADGERSNGVESFADSEAAIHEQVAELIPLIRSCRGNPCILYRFAVYMCRVCIHLRPGIWRRRRHLMIHPPIQRP